MAINPTTGANTSNAVAGATLAFGAVALTTGRDVLVSISITDVSKSVSGVTDTALNTYTLRSSATDGANISLEIWAAHNITGNAADVVLITFTGPTLASACLEEYSGVPSIGHTGGAASGSNIIGQSAGVVLQEDDNWLVGAVAFASQSGDTLSTATEGTLRRSIIPALTSAGTAMLDQTAPIPLTMILGARISTSRPWAAASVELRSGGAVGTFEIYDGPLPIPGQILSYKMPDYLVNPTVGSGPHVHGFAY